MKRRVALLTNIPTPYRLSFYRQLARFWDLRVIFDDASEPNRQWQLDRKELDFAHHFSRGLRLRHVRKRPDLAMNDDRYIHLKFDLLVHLFRIRPEVIITGEFGARTLQAMLYGWLMRKPVIIWSEVTPHTEARTSAWKSALRRFLVKRASGFWSNGEESSRILEAYGARAAQIQPGMTGVDTRFFAVETRRWLGERERLRREAGLSGTTFLFVGQFIERKGIPHYIEALEGLAMQRPRGWSAVFAGSGPLEGALRDWSARHPEIPVVFTGFVQSVELPRLYAMADLFVMPTLEDNWSLVALEAAVAGLPQLFSRYNGCASDLHAGGEAGHVIDPLRTGEFAQALREAVDAPPARLRAELADRLLEYYGPEAAARRAAESVQALCLTMAPAAGMPAASPEGAPR